MPEQDTAHLGDRLVSQTETYLGLTVDCVACLPELLDAYPADDYGAVVDRVAALESDCDRANRRICALVADADVRDLGIRLTRVHLHAGQTIELFHALDEVANAVEQFATDLAAFRPSLPPARRRRFVEMAECAVDAMDALRSAVTDYVAVLCNPEESTSIADDVERVRDVESECDRLRNDAVAEAFADADGETALVCRELAAVLDDVVDAMEDVTDRMVRTTGSDLAIEAEPEVSQP
ncbi:MAG: DUF47 domain-containing protein [Halobacterium sp.]